MTDTTVRDALAAMNLDAIEARHTPTGRMDYRDPDAPACDFDGFRWPCDTARLLPIVRAAVATSRCVRGQGELFAALTEQSDAIREALLANKDLT